MKNKFTNYNKVEPPKEEEVVTKVEGNEPENKKLIKVSVNPKNPKATVCLRIASSINAVSSKSLPNGTVVYCETLQPDDSGFTRVYTESGNPLGYIMTSLLKE